MAKSQDYWQKRFEAVEAMNNATAKKTVQSVIPAFDQAQAQIEKELNAWYQRFADNNQIDLTEAKRLLTTRELKEFRWDIEKYIEYGQENSLDQRWMKELENASARYHVSRLEALKIRTQNAAEVAFGNELDHIDQMAARIYTDDYYHTAYEIQRGLGIGWNVGQVDQKKLDKIVSRPWTSDKKTFSDRIWTSKTQLIDSVHTELTQMCVLGKSPDQAIKNISDRMNVSKNQAGRLIMTEAAYFGSAAQKDAFNDLDVEKFEIVATLDRKTSNICQQMDGKVFDMKDFQIGVTAPPFHVWCRTVTVPWFEDNDDGTRAARGADGKTYQVPANMKYQDWKDHFVDKTKDPDKWLKKATVDDIKEAFKTGTAKTIKEAIDETSKHAGSVSLKGVKNLDSLNEMNGTLNHLYDTYDLKDLREVEVKVNRKGGTMASANFRSLYPRSKFMNDPVEEVKTSTVEWVSSRKAVIKQYEDSYKLWENELGKGRYSDKDIKKTLKNYENAIKGLQEDLKYSRHNVVYQGQEVRSVITHEFGHVIADQKIGQINKKLACPDYENFSYNECYKKVRMVEEVYRKAIKNGDIYKVSKYASTDAHEFFAECFTMYDFGMEELPEYIVEMIEGVIK